MANIPSRYSIPYDIEKYLSVPTLKLPDIYIDILSKVHQLPEYKVGEIYETYSGDIVEIIEEVDNRGIMVFNCSDDIQRYSKGPEASDTGRVVGQLHNEINDDDFIPITSGDF